MAKLPHLVMEDFTKAKSKAEKVAVLRSNESWALKDLLKGTLDPKVKWDLPEGAPPYQPSSHSEPMASIFRENTKFRYFVKNNNINISQIKREQIFIGVLEAVHPKDAELVINMINKKSPVKGLTLKIAQEAFPDL
tara:strand:+ start:351 stop:758 length:408 start_codon:yes stop_codon:yes gene_type:complete